MLPNYLLAQLLDDSTRQVYGTTTTRFFLQTDWIGDSLQLRYLDTTLRAFHRFHPVRQYQYTWQDLGHNLGTAMQPIFPVLPEHIGQQTGWKVYEPYVLHANQVKYFDTKSPYTHFYYVLGGRGQQIAELEFSRNITPRWNFGFLYRRTNTFRQFFVSGDRNEDAILEQYNFVFHMSRHTQNGRYRWLAHYAHFNAPMVEYGGILPEENDTPDSLYRYEEARAQLLAANSWQTQNRYLFYQDYRPDSLFQLYHELRYVRQRDTYNDPNLPANPNPDFYGNLTTTRISDNAIYRELRNDLGVKGTWRDFRYRFFYRNRIHDQRYSWQADDRQGSLNFGFRMEHHVGGLLRWRQGRWDMYGEAQYWLGRDYLLRAHLRAPWLELDVQSSYVSPTWQQQYYWGSAGFWRNDFRPVWGNQLDLRLPVRWRSVQYFAPFTRLLQTQDWIYFTSDTEGRVLPAQFTNTQLLWQLGVQNQLQWRHWHWHNQLYFSRVLSAESIWRLPEWFWFTTFFYEQSLFRNNMKLHIGVDGRYQSAFNAYSYTPLHKVFYLSDEYSLRGYFILDAFAALRVKQFRAALQMLHLNQGLLPPPFNGYQVTPYFVGMRRTFSFSVSWMFFE